MIPKERRRRVERVPAEAKIITERLRAREQAQAMTERIDSLGAALAMDRGLLRDTTRKLEALRDEVDRAKKIAGSMSVLWSKLEPIKPGVRPHDRVDVSIPERFDPASIPIPGVIGRDSASYRRTPLEVFLTRAIPPSYLDGCVHARVEFRDGEVGYGLTADAVRALMHADELERQVVKVIAPEMVRALLDKTVQWHRGRRR